jgi:DNA-directed RNA polymerase subunit RPC12/RpoP
MADYICVRCDQEIVGGFPGIQRYCGPCRRYAMPIKAAAVRAVRSAIVRGDLPSLKNLACVDCGKPAQAYDHRSYEAEKLLDVQPVCRKCNFRRGPAIWRAA